MLSPEVRAQDKNPYLPPVSLAEVVKTQAVDWDISKGTLRVPVIAWGADIITIHANGGQASTASGSLFADRGLKVELYREDVFARQVEAYMRGETPFLRGTLGMINMAAEVAQRSRSTEMRVVYQLSWSAGGDALVVKESIRRPADLRGKTVAVQAFGPHVDYLTTVLASVGLKPSDITIRWVPDLLEVGPDSYSPGMALQKDAEVDAAMVIIPDALALTSGGTVGTGAEGSVLGSRILLSTRTADRVIADVYAVRRDFHEKNPEAVRKFVAGLMEAEREVLRLAQENDEAWKSLMKSSAGILIDDPNAIDDMQGMFGDAALSGLSGNQRFFHDSSYLRRFNSLNQEIQKAFINLNLLKAPVALSGPDFQFQEIVGGSFGFETQVEETRFDPDAVAELVSRKSQANSLDDNELYSFEIRFSPNQNSFPAELYKQEFQKVMELVSTYGGAIMTIEGHSDPLGYLKKKQNGASRSELNKIRQTAKNLSYTRASEVKLNLVDYATSLGITLDVNQFGVVGHGIMRPNTQGVGYESNGDLALVSAPLTRDEWEATRRVVFRLIQVEAETSAFEPLF